MPLKVTAAQARRYAGKSYKPRRRQKAQMDPALFEAALEFRRASEKRNGFVCWHKLIMSGPVVQCEEGC